MFNPEIPILIKMISEGMQRERDNDLKNIDLTFSQAHALMMINFENGFITQKSIENELHISHSATHGILKRLEDKGLIESAVSDIDKRQKVLKITLKGREKISLVTNKMKSRRNNSSDMSEEELNELARLLRKMANTMFL